MLSASLHSHLREALPTTKQTRCTPFKKCPADSSGQQGNVFADVIVQVHHVWALYQVSMSFLA